METPLGLEPKETASGLPRIKPRLLRGKFGPYRQYPAASLGIGTQHLFSSPKSQQLMVAEIRAHF